MAKDKKIEINLEDEAVETASPEVSVEEVVTKNTTKEKGMSVEDKAEIAAAAATAVATAMAELMPKQVAAGMTMEVDRVEDSTVLNARMRKLDGLRQQAAREYGKEEKVIVTISPAYRPYLGKTANISVNGVSVFVPVDGRPYRVNATHAALILGSVRKYDEQITRNERLADVNRNFEQSPGALKFY